MSQSGLKELISLSLAFTIGPNTRMPTTIVSSAFNHLFVVLNTGAEEPGTGFAAEYIESIRKFDIVVPTNASGKVN